MSPCVRCAHLVDMTGMLCGSAAHQDPKLNIRFPAPPIELYMAFSLTLRSPRLLRAHCGKKTNDLVLA